MRAESSPDSDARESYVIGVYICTTYVDICLFM